MINQVHKRLFGKIVLGFIFAGLFALSAGCSSKSTTSQPDSPQQQEKFPSKNITCIIPYSAGGGNDIFARISAPKLKQMLGVEVIVENKPGGGSSVGIVEGLRATADGHTMIGISSPGTEIASLETKIFKLEDFKPLGAYTADPHILIVGPKSPYDSFEKLLAAIKANPGKIKMGCVGPVSSAAIMGEKIKEALGVSWVNIPYEGGADATAAVMGGHVDFQIATLGRNYTSHKDGRLKILCITMPERFESAKDVPTFKEITGIALYGAAKRGTVVSAKVPEDRYKVLLDAYTKLLKDPEFIKESDKTNPFVYTGPEEWTKELKESMKDVEKYLPKLTAK